MSLSRQNEDPASSGAGQFNTTHWSVVLVAGQTEAPQAEAALESLCRTYWYPLYAYIRRKGHIPQDAQDLTQEFFALAGTEIFQAGRRNGAVPVVSLEIAQPLLVNEWVRGQAQKRGGGQKILSMDEEAAERIYQQEPASASPPESLYDKRWAVTLLERAMDRLGADYAAAGKEISSSA
jgi:RNA polymerase sigma-70 factor (ECF subfamily)